MLLLNEQGAGFLSHDAMAVRLGCSRETVSRVLIAWSRGNVVRRQPQGGLAVVDRSALEKKSA